MSPDKKYRRRYSDSPGVVDRRTAPTPASFYFPARWEWEPESGKAVFSVEWVSLLAVKGDKTALGGDMQFLFDRVHEDDIDTFHDALTDTLEGVTASLEIPVRLKRMDETWGWILFKGESYRGEGGAPVVAGIAVDVSRLRLNERFFPPVYNTTPSTYQTLLDNSPTYIVRFDKELFPLYVNPAAGKLVNCKLEELGDKTVEELGTETDDLKFIAEGVSWVFNTGRIFKERRAITTSTVGRKIMDYTFWPEFDADGKTVKTVLTQGYDQTENVFREQETRLNELRFASLYQITQMQDATEEEIMRFAVKQVAVLTGSEHSHIFIPNSSLFGGGYTMWSSGNRQDGEGHNHPNIWREFNNKDDARIRMTVPMIVNDPSKRPPEYFWGDKQTIKRYMTVPVLENDQLVCMTSVYNRLTDYSESDMKQVALFLQGVTLVLRQRGYVNALKSAKESAEQANAVKNRFLANVSHELRTPLNGLMSMLQLLQFTSLSREQQEFADNAMLTAKTLMRIISDILDFSRMEAGSVQLTSAPFDLANTLKSTVELFRKEANKKGLTLELEISDVFPEQVCGDEARIRQIIFNLLGNAFKFTESGGIKISCVLMPRNDPGKHWFYIKIKDTGIGIPKDMLSKVFNAFVQVHADRSKHQGTGLGLGIVRHLITQMEGTVTMESELGEGTTVHCSIALETVTSQDDAEQQDAPGDNGYELRPLSVLVAEDDTVSRMSMRLFLERFGCRTVCVENGRIALEMLRLRPFDCLISDVLMPEMDGIELTHRIREGLWKDVIPADETRSLLPVEMWPDTDGLCEIPSNLPIITASAHAMQGDKERFLEEGMDFYISKPVIVSELADVLKKVQERIEEEELFTQVSLE